MERTYKEAVEIMVDWWIEKMKAPLNQNNGDDFPLGFMLANTVSMRAQQTLTKTKEEAFKQHLTKELLSKNPESGMYATMLEVDYHPNKLLEDAVEKSGIDSGCLPIKTHTYIDAENHVCGSYQYRGEPFII